MVTPLFQPYVVPATVVILVGLFLIQRYGTHRVGGLFGPVMVIWFVVARGAGPRVDRQASGRPRRLRPAARDRVLPRQRLCRVHRARGGLPGGHRRGSALCGHGTLRPEAHPSGVVRPGAAVADPELPGPGRAAAARAGDRPSVLPAGAVVGAAAAGRPGHRGRDHRVPGADLGFVLDYPPGDPAGPRSPARGRAHLGARDGPDLRPAGQLGADVRDAGHRHRFRVVHRAGCGLRHRRHA